MVIKTTVLLGVLYATTVCVSMELKGPMRPTSPTADSLRFARSMANSSDTPCTTRNNMAMFGKNGVIDERYRWKDFNVHPSSAYTKNEQQLINNAMWRLSQVIPCVRFGIWPPESTPSGDYVRIIKGTNNGCNSYVGRLGGRQDMNLQSPGCMSDGAILHEMIHALGFHHEHGRPDRDDYIDLHRENMIPGMEYAWEKYPGLTTFGVAYNYISIMHYDKYAFSKNGQPTMTAKNGAEIGSVGVMQDTDIRKLKLMYKC